MYGRTRRFEGRILRRGVSVSSEGKTGEKCDGFSVASSCPREQNQACNNIKQTILIGGQDFFFPHVKCSLLKFVTTKIRGWYRTLSLVLKLLTETVKGDAAHRGIIYEVKL